MSRIVSRLTDWLVPGRIPGPRLEINGRSGFYPDALAYIHGTEDDRHDDLTPSAQELGTSDSIELSTVSSVTSEDVTMPRVTPTAPIPETQPAHTLSKHKPVKPRSSYAPIKVNGEIKILVVGGKGAGKSSFVQRATDQENDSFCCQHSKTNLLNCKGKLLEHYGKLYFIIFWEIIDGTQLLDEQLRDFYSGAMAAFLVWEMPKMDESSIIEQKKKINNAVCKKNGDPIPVYLLASKCDTGGCENNEAMTELAKVNGFADYFKTSAKTGEGIEEAVRAALKEVLRETYPRVPEVCETPDHLKR